MKFLSSVESWNSVFEWGSLFLVAGTVAFGAGAIVTSRVIKIKQERAIADANQRAEEARLKTAEIQAIVEWRTLSQDQIAKLQSALSARPSSVKFVYVSNDPEALFLAIQLSNKAFTNWNVTSESRDFSGTMVFGLRIEGTSEQDVNFVRDAFRSAEVPFTTEPIPPHGGSVGFGAVIEGQPEPTVEIIVGSKPRPLP